MSAAVVVRPEIRPSEIQRARERFAETCSAMLADMARHASCGCEAKESGGDHDPSCAVSAFEMAARAVSLMP